VTTTLDPKIRKECRKCGVDPKDLLDFCESRGVSHHHALVHGMYWYIRRQGIPETTKRVWAQTAYEAWRVACKRGLVAAFSSCECETEGLGTVRPEKGKMLLYHPRKGPLQAKQQPDISRLTPIGAVNVSGAGRFALYKEGVSKTAWAIKIRDLKDGKQGG
jgi:hypothetical protein